MSNFCFSHSVFKRLALQTRKNQGLFGKGLPVINSSYEYTSQKKKVHNKCISETQTTLMGLEPVQKKILIYLRGSYLISTDEAKFIFEGAKLRWREGGSGKILKKWCDFMHSWVFFCKNFVSFFETIS